MRWMEMLRLRWRSLIGRETLEDRLDEELRFHLEQSIAAKRAEGLSEADARAAALREFGAVDVLKEECRDARGVWWIEQLAQDLRFGWRMLLRNPAFTAASVVSLALGIGGAAAVFSICESILLRELPVSRPWELVTINGKIQRTDGGIAYANFDLVRRAATKTLVGAYASSGRYLVRLTAADRAIDQIAVANVSHSFFDVLGVRPALGRFFVVEDDAVPDSARESGSVAVISHDLWMREFGGSERAVGSAVLVNQASCRIIGVAPDGFRGDAVGESVDVWVPLVPFTSGKSLDAVAGGFYAQYMGRLRDGVSKEQAAAEWTAAYQQIQSTRPKMTFFTRRENAAGWERIEAGPKDYSIAMEPGSLGFDVLRTRFRKPLLLMLGGTLLVFLIGCANVANLILSRGLARRQELAVRAALGAGRGRIVMQILTECLLLAVFASLVGLALGRAGSLLLLSLVDPSQGFEVPLFGWRVGLFLSLLACVAVLLFGLWPSIRQSASLTQASRGEVGRGQRGVRLLVVAQVALSVLLLASASMLARSVRNLQHQDFGFQPQNTVAMTYWLNAKDPKPEFERQIAERLLERARSLPGVSGASSSTAGFFSGQDMFQTLSFPWLQQGDGAGARVDFVSPDYFDVMGVPLVAGRKFRQVEEVPVAIVNEAFVLKLMQGREPIDFEFEHGSRSRARIVGVVRNSRYRNARIDYEPAMFFPVTQATRAPSRIEVRTSLADPRPVMAALRAAAKETDPNVVVDKVRTMTDDIERSFHRESMLAKLAAAFSVLALALACAGIYGTMSYAISRRVGEFALRMALGARPGQVLSLVLGDGVLLIGSGLLVGIPAAWASSRFLESYLFGVQPGDVSTYALVALALAMAGGLAAWFPARRAASVDPAVALRCE